jgi:hypothetical protein
MVMKTLNARFWIGIIAISVVAFCILAFTLATPGAKAGAAAPQPQSDEPTQTAGLQTQSYEGIVTDTHCGAKHSAAVGLSAADCTRACVHSGESFALVDGDKTYALKGEDAALKRAAGERVKILGTLTDNTISVASVLAPAS